MPSILKIVSVTILATLALTGAHMGVEQLSGNFHEVIPGELYRSGQPSGEDVRERAARFGIRTIINLRDEKRDAWYDKELAASKAAGITLINFPMNSGKVLSIADAQKLANIMRAAPKPLLIHCEHGANRTGLASAIYVGGVAHGSELFSEFQLSPYYGHVPIRGIGRYEMYKSWDEYEETIGF